MAGPERHPAPVRKHRRPAADREADLGPWDSELSPGLGGGSRPADLDPLRILLGKVAAAARARTKRTEGLSYDEVASMPRRGGGCVARALVLILFLIALFLVTPFFLSALLGLR
jgi:hypothetical protein